MASDDIKLQTGKIMEWLINEEIIQNLQMKKSKSTVVIEKGKYLVDIEFSTYSLKNYKTSITSYFLEKVCI